MGGIVVRTMSNPPIRTVPFHQTHAPDAARMFVGSLESLRRRVPALPPDLADIGQIQQRLSGMRGVAALDGERLIGYLTGWFPIDGFRDSARVGAYVPEWGHSAATSNRRAVYNALYRVASTEWSHAGCDVHAITLLAGDDAALETWFWSGFGIGTVDAIRPTTPLDDHVVALDTLRIATTADAAALAILDVEHVRHYAAAPVLMPPPALLDEGAWRAFMSLPGNTVWLAEDAEGPFGFIRFERQYHGSAVLESSSGIFISGAYVRPACRRRGAATAMLDAGIRQSAADGVTSCAVDFEGFNPEATAFWLRHFSPVCISLMRVPETLVGREA